MLNKYQNAQLIVIGPVGDAYGTYTKAKLDKLVSSGRFEGKLFVHAGFLVAPPELKLACEFCLMPSRDEPFGYVDIEFAWAGALVVGALRGGLGKLPGFYFRILNADSAVHVQRSLRKAVAAAMACDANKLLFMSRTGRASAFPVDVWQRELSELYGNLMAHFSWEAIGTAQRPHQLQHCKSGLDVELGLAHPAWQPARCLGLPDFFAALRSSLLAASLEKRWPKPLGEQAERKTSRRKAKSVKEFLWQEASESEMQAAVHEKFAVGDVPSADSILAEVEWELDAAHEHDPVSKFLGQKVLGAPVLDWIICLCYVTGPLISAMTISYVSAADSMAFFVIDPLAQALALFAWTMAATAIAPHKLMALACVARVVVLLLPLVADDPRLCAFFVGFVSPSDYVFIYYSFMGSSIGDVGKVAVRTGALMAVRQEWKWFLGALGWTYQSEQAGLRVFCTLAFALFPAAALLRAPRLYREFRLPGFDFSWANKVHFLVLLGLASVLQSLSYVSESALLVTRQTSPFYLESRARFCLMLGICAAVPVLILAQLLQQLPCYSMVVVKAFACFSLPAVLLQSWVQVEINQATGLTWGLDLVICISVAFGGLSIYAVAVAVLATVGSRWRFVSYTMAVGIGSNLAKAASFGIAVLWTGVHDPLRSYWLPQDLAWELLVIAAPFCVLSQFFRVAAFFYFDKEATGMLRTARQRLLMRHASGRSPLCIPVGGKPLPGSEGYSAPDA